MKPPAIPENERRRLDALRSHSVLDTEPERPFDDLARLAAEILDTPIALVSLVDEARQWFKARYGLEAPETPRDVSFCGHVVAESRMLVVPDAFADTRFADNPLVTGEPRVRFYAGAPLETRAGLVLGTLCAIDHAPREPTPRQLEALQILARQVMAQLELRLKVIELGKLEQAKDAFVAMVSHDLRTPLTSILGSLRLLEGGALGGLPEQAMELVEIGRSSSERLLRLLDGLLDLQKIEAGRLERRRAPVEPRALAERAIAELRVLSEAAEVELVAQVAAEGPLEADADRLLQVLTNLLGNAIKFSPRGARVTLEIGAAGERVRFAVRDEGPGIAAEECAQLFERFSQLEEGRRHGGGTGLGLAISKAIVEAHGGEIGVESRLGEGSCFWLELPRGKPAP